jgi:hypothetical protein
MSNTDTKLDTKLNLAFYVYFYGSDNNVAYKIPPLPSDKYDCYYYTNNKRLYSDLANTKYIAIYEDKPTQDDMIESNMVGKHIKALPHLYPELNKYDYVCYLDSKLGKINNKFIEDYIQKYFIEQNYAMLIRNHGWVLPNVWAEYNESMMQERYVYEKDKYVKYIFKQVENGLSEITNTHCTNNFMVRNMNHTDIIKLNTTWYEHILECGIQDQISFFFVKQLFNNQIYSFNESPFE